MIEYRFTSEDEAYIGLLGVANNLSDLADEQTNKGNTAMAYVLADLQHKIDKFFRDLRDNEVHK